MALKDEKQLFRQFENIDREKWEQKASEDTGGKDLSKLKWKTYEGFDVDPFYVRQDLSSLSYLTESLPAAFPYARGNRYSDNKWEVCQRITDSDVDQANKKALEALGKGADSVTFSSVLSRKGVEGVSVQSSEDMSRLLRGIPLERTPVNFETGTGGIEILSLFLIEAERRNVDFSDLRGCLFYDPLGYFTSSGMPGGSSPVCTSEIINLIDFREDRMPRYRMLCVDGSRFYESGANAVQELAFAMAMGVEYLVQLSESGVDVDRVARSMFFSLSAAPDFFIEVAKLRAARTIWANLVEKFEPADESSKKAYIHSKTTRWNKTVYDSYVNLLRTTVESISAVTGGCDLLTVEPFNETHDTPDAFAMRMARNAQLIIREESFMDRVSDPAAGSYYIENLTSMMIEKTFGLFLSIEEKGGYLESLRSGYIRDQVESSASVKKKDVGKRKLVLLGTNQYPDTNETMVESTGDGRSVTGLSLTEKSMEPGPYTIEGVMNALGQKKLHVGDIITSRIFDEGSSVPSISSFRGAESFENLRFATERASLTQGSRPSVFLYKTGSITMSNARATFSRNFFGCAGFGIIEPSGFDDVSRGIDAIAESSAEIVVFCSSDDEYTNVVSEVVPALREKKPELRFVVAGYPEKDVENLRKAGVDNFIHKGSNALEELSRFQKMLGIES